MSHSFLSEVRRRLRAGRRRWAALTLRLRIAIELGVLSVMTVVFLLSDPRRTIAVDVPLALLAWGLVGLNAGYTRDVIWARRPESDLTRRRQGARQLLWITIPAMALFLLLGGVIGYQAGGWTSAAHRLFPRNMLPAFGLYLVWAFLQQTLFQFYLLGRLKRLFPALPPLALCAFNGAAFALVHWPNPVLMLLTAAAGTVWSYSYYEHGRLWPIALSHAALGSMFYYWIYGRDLAAVWFALVPH